MGQIQITENEGLFTSVLGSSVGIYIYSQDHPLGVFAHAVLAATPSDFDATRHPGKYVLSAVPEMIRVLTEQGVSRSSMAAKLVGGSCMFGKVGPEQMGPKNVDTAEKAITKESIPIVAKHVGGSKGRSITIDAANGELTIELIGEASTTL